MSLTLSIFWIKLNSSQYWNRLKKSTPALEDPERKMKISVKELQRIVEKAFKEGQKHPEKTEQDLAKEVGAIGKGNDIGDLFGGIFGQ